MWNISKIKTLKNKLQPSQILILSFKGVANVTKQDKSFLLDVSKKICNRASERVR